MPAVFSARTAKRTLYLLASLPLGICYFTVLVTGLSVGLGTAITLVGLPILVGTLHVWRGMAMFERRLVGALLEREIPESYRASTEPGWWPRTRTRIADPATWKDLAYLVVVAEALANIAKYAQASSAVVEVRVEAGALVVEVSDDGVGGADPQSGSGLRGLVDRVGALDGTLHVESPAGLGTALRAELPLRAAGPTPAG